MGFFGLGGKSSRKERAAAKAEAAKAALGSAGKQYQASKPQGKENKPNKAAKKSKDEKLRPKGSEKKTSKQATSRKDEGQLLIKKNEAMELRHSIVSDRRKSRVSTPAPTNTNATEAFSSASWKATVIAKYVESMDWVGLENMLWHVSTSVFNDTSLRKSILQEAVPQECIKAATHPRASQGVVQKAVYIVSQVSFLDEAETPLVQEGVIPMLRSILGLSTDSHTISSAVQSLRNLMGGSEKTSFQVGKEQCAIYLLQILQGSHRVVFDSIDVEVSTKRESAAAIANLTHFGPKYQNQLIRAKGVDVFMKVLSTTTDDETKYQLTKALANCALEARWHGILVAHGVILEAQRILRSCREPETVAEASRILGNIALTSAGRARIVDLGGVEELTEKLVNSASSAPAAPIPDLVNTLYNICLSERPALTACLRGAVPVLLDLALLPKSSEDTSELVRVTALNTLINISQTGQMQHVVKAFNDAAESADPKRIVDILGLRLQLENLLLDSRKSLEVPRSLEHLSKASQHLNSQSRGSNTSKRAQNFHPSGRMVALKKGQGSEIVRGSVTMAPKDKSIELKQDQFILGQILGRGGYGTVYLAQKLGTDDSNYVAIKQFHTADTQQNLLAAKEQKIWEGLDHENVVKYEGCFIGDDGDLNLVSEYVDGWSLARHLSRYSAFPEDLVVEIARQVLDGLEYLHNNGVIHRDLKPANVLVSQDGKVKITDFGVSSSANVQTLGYGNAVVGTPWYIAPEMVEQRPYTNSVDIWSLGCTILELATGKRPYHELNGVQALFRMVKDKQPTVPPTLSADLQSFLRDCWVREPHSRPSAAELKNHPFLTPSEPS